MRIMNLSRVAKIKKQAGTIERNIFSNLMVKSKSSRHPRTIGPKVLSSGHPDEKSIRGVI